MNVYCICNFCCGPCTTPVAAWAETVADSVNIAALVFWRKLILFFVATFTRLASFTAKNLAFTGSQSCFENFSYEDCVHSCVPL